MFGCILLTLNDYFENVNPLKSGNVTSHVLWGVPTCDTCLPYLLESKGHAPEMRNIQRKGVKKRKSPVGGPKRSTLRYFGNAAAGHGKMAW